MREIGFLQQLYRSMDLIAFVCGNEWLSRLTNISGRRYHPLRAMWNEVNQLLNGSPLPFDLTPYRSVGEVIQLGTTLSWTIPLPGFDAQIVERLKRRSSYEDVLYELWIARTHAIRKHDIRFIDPEGKERKGADLAVFVDGKEIMIEAKRRIAVKFEAESDRITSLRGDLLTDFVFEMPPGFNVLVLLLGDVTEQSLIKAKQIAIKMTQDGFIGDQYISDPGFWVVVEQLPFFPSSLSKPDLDEWLYRNDRRGIFVRDFTRPSGDQPWIGKTCMIRTLPGQPVDNILGRVKDAAKQIPERSLSAVCVHVEHGQMSLNEANSSLSWTGEAVGRRLWGRGRLSRIRAIVMTGGPYSEIVNHDGYSFIRNTYGHHITQRGGMRAGRDHSPTSLIEGILESEEAINDSIDEAEDA